MNLLRRAIFRARSIFKRENQLGELDDEIKFHLENLTQEFLDKGMSPKKARAAALQEFGNVDSLREACLDNWRTRLVSDFWRDVKFGIRQLRKSLGFTIVSTLTLGLAIGACVTIFCVLDSVLLRPLPYPEPEQVVVIWETKQGGINSISGGAFVDWRDNSELAEEIALHSSIAKILQTDLGPVRLYGREVTDGFLDIVGLAPLRGRGFLPDESAVGGNNHVVVLSEKAWNSRFGRDESLIGQTITLNTIPHEVIGIMSDEAWEHNTEEFFVPAVLDPNDYWRYTRSNHWASAWARLKPNVTPEQFDNELKAIKSNLNNEYPQYKKDWNVTAYALHNFIIRPLRPVIYTLTGAAILVLLIACANIANLLLAKGASRNREIAMRTALGASSKRIVRQTLTESLTLACMGGVLGIILSIISIHLIEPFATNALPGNISLALDVRTLISAIAFTGGAGLVFGALPALKLRQTNISDILKAGGKSSSGRTRSQSVLVIAEVALTVILLSSAGLLLRDLREEISVDPGFNPENTITFETSLPGETYESPEKRAAFINSAIGRIERLPEVSFVGSSSISTLADGGSNNYISRPDQPGSELDHMSHNHYVGGDFFEAMGTQLIRGRFIDQSDNSKLASLSAVIDEKMATALFGTDDPIGQYISGGVTGKTWEIVGVVAEMKIATTEMDGALFLPHFHQPDYINFTVRAHSSSSHLIDSLRSTIASIDAGIPLANIRTLDEARENYFAQDRLIISLILGFAIVATTLACIGLYGVMSYSVATRRRELSIRRSLGATSENVISLVLQDGGKLTVIGLAIGIVLTTGVGRILSSKLYHISSYDPLVLLVTTIIIACVSLISCGLPARRATRLNPNAALRGD